MSYFNQVGQDLAQSLFFTITQITMCVEGILLTIETQGHAVQLVLNCLWGLKGDLCGRPT